MRGPRIVCVLLAVAAAAAGCNKIPGFGGKTAGPGEAVAEFLNAVCAQNQDKMFGMLTTDARGALKSHDMSPQLPSSGTTSFEVGEIEMVEGGAHVMSKWYDQMEDGTSAMTGNVLNGNSSTPFGGATSLGHNLCNGSAC